MTSIIDHVGEASPAMGALSLSMGGWSQKTPLIGREKELDLLQRSLDRMLSTRHLHIVTVLGAQGIGKSRLVYSFLAQLRQQRRPALRTFRTSPNGVRDSYGLFSRLFRARFGLADGLSESAMRQALERQVSDVLPGRRVDDVLFFVGQLLGVSFNDDFLSTRLASLATEAYDDPDHADHLTEAAMLRRLAFRTLLTADAMREPLCLVFEDLDDASTESLQLLEFLLETTQAPILAVCCARHELESRYEGWRHLRQRARHFPGEDTAPNGAADTPPSGVVSSSSAASPLGSVPPSISPVVRAASSLPLVADSAMTHAPRDPALSPLVDPFEDTVARDSGSTDSVHRVIELGPLPAPQAAQLVANLLRPCGDPPRQLIEAACELAGGNPSLLEQMVRIFRDTGVLEEEDEFAETTVWQVHLDKLATVQLPLTVEEAAQARIAALTPEQRRILERAAIVGPVFWLGAVVVQGRIGRQGPELWSVAETKDTVEIASMLQQLADKDYVLRVPDATFANEQEYIFKQYRERERLLKLIAPSVAQKYHRAVAGWLERQQRAVANEEYSAMLAFHREAAGCEYGAARMYLNAGDVARAKYSATKAVEYYRQGLLLLHDDEPLRRMNVYHDLGDCLLQLGSTDEALASFREMLAMAYRYDHKAKGGAAHNRIGRLHREQGNLDDALVHLSAGLDLFEACHDVPGVASSLDDIGKVYWLRGDYALALNHMQRALDMRKQLGNKRSMALSLNNIGLVLHASSALQEALEVLDQALRIRREIGDQTGEVATLNSIAMVRHDQGQFAEAQQVLDQAQTIARQVGDRGQSAVALTIQGKVLLAMGHVDEAIACYEQAVEQCDEVNCRIEKAEALRCLGQAQLADGKLAKARDSISKAVDILVGSKNKVQLATALRSLGQITVAGGWGPEHMSRGKEYFKRAVAIFEQVGNQLELARSLQAYADYLHEHEPGVASSTSPEMPLWEQLQSRAASIFQRLSG